MPRIVCLQESYARLEHPACAIGVSRHSKVYFRGPAGAIGVSWHSKVCFRGPACAIGVSWHSKVCFEGFGCQSRNYKPMHKTWATETMTCRALAAVPRYAAETSKQVIIRLPCHHHHHRHRSYSSCFWCHCKPICNARLVMLVMSDDVMGMRGG